MSNNNNNKDQEQISGCSGLGIGWGVSVSERASTRKPCSDRTMLYLDCGHGYMNLHMW